MNRTTEEHFEEYRRDGFTVFRGYMPQDRLRATRSIVDPIFEDRFRCEPDTSRTTIADLLGHDTLGTLLRPHLINDTVLDFAERVMGPFVQLDSFEITGFPKRPASWRGDVAEWHRDAFNYSDMWAEHPASRHFKPHPYTAPTACNCLTYLQEMTEETGALRVIPGSHLDFTHIPTEGRRQAHPREVCLSLEAGDMVFTHNEILHAGSTNTGTEIRYFISAYLQRIGLPHRDRFDTPAVTELIDRARAKQDKRLMRLFGEDSDFEAREQAAWHRMIEEDRGGLPL